MGYHRTALGGRKDGLPQADQSPGCDLEFQVDPVVFLLNVQDISLATRNNLYYLTGEFLIHIDV
jgi:hypothetical protein